MKIAIIGGGAAGFFAALAAKEADSTAEITIFEKSAKLLSKVRISGGGRCNVTHACFEPRELINHYPRGSKELLGPFHQFQPRDTIEWFQTRGVKLKTEADGRMFPVTNSSQTVIDCFLNEAQKLGVKIQTQAGLTAVEKVKEGYKLTIGDSFVVDRLILATGSAPFGWEIATQLQHTVESPVPSLFTFNVPQFSLEEQAGVTVESARLRLQGTRLEQIGPLLITHWGFSGPAALKLSAFAARYLSQENYEVTLAVDWLPKDKEEKLIDFLGEEKELFPARQLGSLRAFALPKKLWRALVERFDYSSEMRLDRLSKKAILRLCQGIKNDLYKVSGKTTNKEEFVTCGGIKLPEVNFKTMESKCSPGLFFCGEVLNIDGVTGGFNFQNAWTTGWLAGRSVVKEGE